MAGEAVSYTNGQFDDPNHVITTGWTVFDGECMDVMDAPTRGKALFGSMPYTEGPGYERYFRSLKGFRVRRRKDLDGVTFADVRYIIWPCKERPCPGCSCCEDGYCSDDDA